jgi:hypothetical protein
MSERLKAAIGEKGVQVVRGQYHKFMLIPIMEHHAQFFDAGPICIAVEARALGSSREKMVRGPSIHVFSADRKREFLRFDLFGGELHYHYIHDAPQHNTVWGYDQDANGPMLDWVIRSLRERLPEMLRRSGEAELATRIERDGWDTAVLAQVEQAARDADRETEDEMDRAREGIEWMLKWKDVHPQFNTVDY